MSALRVALCGNPNVGKSTVFNALTGLRQHTGNWAGKTVDTARGQVREWRRTGRSRTCRAPTRCSADHGGNGRERLSDL